MTNPSRGQRVGRPPLIHLEDLLPADFSRGGHLRGKSTSEDTMAKEFRHKDAVLWAWSADWRALCCAVKLYKSVYCH